MRTLKHLYLLLLALVALPVLAQDDDFFSLMEVEEPTQFVYATFKGTRLINGQTIETPGGGVLQYVIAHRFGSFADDYLYNFLGLDNAQIRMQLDYGVNDRLNVGLGRSSTLKVVDGFVKYRVLRQRSGKNDFPFSLTWHSNMSVRGARYTDGIDHYFSDRLSYVHQALFARKFNSSFSAQLAPTVVHWNLVPTRSDANTIYGLSAGARYKLTNRIAATAEYTWHNDPLISTGERNYFPLALGVDIETGGHVFQLHISNTRNMSDPYWISRNPYNVLDGGLFLGFNISRVFTLKE